MGLDILPITGVILATIVVSVACGQLLRLHDVSSVTATFSSIAGGASGMVALADDFGADSRVVLVNQYLRVLFILLTLPIVVTTVFSSSTSDSGGGGLALWTGGPIDYLYVVLALLLGLVAGKLLRLPSPSLLGPLVLGVVLSSLPAFDSPVVPGWIQAVGFLLLGGQVGLRFTKQTMGAVARMMPTAVLVIVLSVASCAGLGVALALITDQSQLDAYLATTPGGLPAVLATSTDAAGNVTFVTAAQTIRLLLVLLLAPYAARLLFPRRDD
jgi:membrane AbrB-like protein